MAVVFISPKQRQKMFFLGITILFLLLMAIVFFGVFVLKPDESSVAVVFNKPKVNIDMKVFESDQFKNLKDFTEMEILFSYIVTGKDGKQKSGFLAAPSMEIARAQLEDQGYFINDLQEAKVGRPNPFTPYYEGGAQGTVKK